MRRRVFTRDEAAQIVDIFEEILFRHNISVPSPEDDERDKDDMMGLYGSTYYDLLDGVEEHLVELLEKMPAEIISYKFSGNV